MLSHSVHFVSRIDQAGVSNARQACAPVSNGTIGCEAVLSPRNGKCKNEWRNERTTGANERRLCVASLSWSI